jgi:putative flippase GtrA
MHRIIILNSANPESGTPGTLLIFLRYAIIGAIVGISAAVGREIIAMAFPADTPGYYALSVSLVYVFGILASYSGHRKVTFGHVDMKHQSTARSMTNFTVIALLGLLCTTGLSVTIRYFFPVDDFFGSLGGAFSFILATLIASVITFSLNARHTFSDKVK